MPVVALRIEPLSAFRDRKIIIVAAGFAHIKEIGTALACFDTLAVHALLLLVVVVVRHLLIVWLKCSFGR